MLFELLLYGFTQNTEYIYLYEQFISIIWICQLYFMLFHMQFTWHGICINFNNQQIYYLINLHFFVACVVQPKSVLMRYLETLLDFQNYEFLDFILQCDLFSSVEQLKVKHQLLHNCSFDDQTSMKILDFQRQTVNIRNSLIHQRKLLLFFLIHLKNACNIRGIFIGTFREYSYIQYSRNIIWEYFPEFQRAFFRIFLGYIMRMFHEYSTNMYLPDGLHLVLQFQAL